ncbi:MAG: hypothetical protein ACP5QP_02060 [Brevinematia bacterium]
MKILSKEEVKNYESIRNFVVKDDDVYYGFFRKERGILKSYGKIVSISINDFIEKDEKLIYSTIRFKYKNSIRKSILRVSKKKESLVFDLYIISHKGFQRISIDKSFSYHIFEEIVKIYTQNPITLKESTLTLVEAIMPSAILEWFKKLAVVYLDLDEELEFIPFELLFDKYNIVFKRIKSKSEKKNFFIKKILIISNGWDSNFSYTVEESIKITKFFGKNFYIDFFSQKLDIKEFFSLVNGCDMLYISTHANGEKGIDLGNFYLDDEIVKSLPEVPKFVFINTCFFDRLDLLVEEFLRKGTNSLICSYFKVPDSFQTRFFVNNFFFTFSRTFDLDLSTFVAMKISSKHKHYNHLLYRIFV